MEHNKGLNQSTKHLLPWELVFYEAYKEEADARRRETYLKTTQGRLALRRMLRDYMKNTADLGQQKVYY